MTGIGCTNLQKYREYIIYILYTVNGHSLLTHLTSPVANHIGQMLCDTPSGSALSGVHAGGREGSAPCERGALLHKISIFGALVTGVGFPECLDSISICSYHFVSIVLISLYQTSFPGCDCCQSNWKAIAGKPRA